MDSVSALAVVLLIWWRPSSSAPQSADGRPSRSIQSPPLPQPLTLRPGTGPSLSLEWLDSSSSSSGEESLSRPPPALRDRIASGNRWMEHGKVYNWYNHTRHRTLRPQRPLVWGPPTPEYEYVPPPSPNTFTTRISERKCAEFARLQTERVVALPLVPDPKPSVNHVQKCEQNSAPLVVGGEDARLHEFPHMAAIGYTGPGGGGRLEWNCGGSLISDMFVLTAAHCTATAQGPPKVVRLGDHNLESNEDGARPLDVTVSSMVRHPDYRPPARYDDIGLLRLSRKVPFSSAIRPACLHSDSQISEPLIATGWGLTEQLGERSQVLQKVILNFVDHETCSSLYAADATTSSLARGIVSESQLCAGVLSGGMDTCQGDSGGPLQIKSQNNQCVFLVVGVTSFGKVCAARNSPGVYTRVSKYVSWIERHVWPQEKSESYI